MPELTPLGEPPNALAHQYEAPVVKLETDPLSGRFEAVPWLGDQIEARFGANAEAPTAMISVSLANNPDLRPRDPADPSSYVDPVDWQVVASDLTIQNIWDEVLSGRRIRIQTDRSEPADNWVIFEGFVDRLELGWNGGPGPAGRWARLYCTSTVIAADRELSQHIVGQWRRSYGAQNKLRGLDRADPDPDDLAASNVCVRVTALAMIFNPGGIPNCDPTPLRFTDDSVVYIPTDDANTGAIPWTVAKMLRYVQWAAMQPDPPTDQAAVYTTKYVSDTSGVKDLQDADHWTSFPLGHFNLDNLLAVRVAEGKAIIDSPPGRTNRADLQALLRWIPSLSIDGMSTLEALAFLCDRAGILMGYFHDVADGGRVRTNVYYAIRGDRDGSKALSPLDPVPTVTRGVYLRLPSDRAADDADTVAQLFDAFDVIDGSIIIDESGIRPSVYELGDPTEYEFTVDLLPGWLPDDFWDIDQDDPDAISNAQGRVGQPEWNERYHRAHASGINLNQYASVGRLWVLNEDGGFPAKDDDDLDLYNRETGPWANDPSDPGDDKWRAYRFKTDGRVEDLEGQRGDDGFSQRRRRFLPATADADGAPAGVITSLSLDGGITWRQIGAKVWGEEKRCAIFIDTADLAAVGHPDFDKNYPVAYIEGLARVRVTANIEGDDACIGFANKRRRHTHSLLPWWTLEDRRGGFRRVLRTKANSTLPGRGYLLPADIDDTGDARAQAQRTRGETEIRRCPGQVRIPWWSRHTPGQEEAYPSYGVGDEILGIDTGRNETFLNLRGTQRGAVLSPRIVGITYRWSEDPSEQSTTLTIEDNESIAEDMVGNPRPGDEIDALTEGL